MNIIDTHTHFFDPTRPEGVPWPPPDNELLYKPTYPKEFISLSKPLGVTGTVVVEASKWLEDNEWILDLAASNPVILGMVGNVDVFDADFEKHLDRFSQNPLFRGVRIGRNALQADLSEKLISSLKALAAKELALDLLVGAAELPEVCRIAGLVPDLNIMLDHIAHVPIDGTEPDKAWRDGIAECGKHDSIYCKVSGLVEASVTRPAPTDPSYYKLTFDALLQAFGLHHLVYGSNWPVCRMAGTYETVFSLAKEYFEAVGDDAVDSVFRKNALSCYRCVESRSNS